MASTRRSELAQRGESAIADVYTYTAYVVCFPRGREREREASFFRRFEITRHRYIVRSCALSYIYVECAARAEEILLRAVRERRWRASILSLLLG